MSWFKKLKSSLKSSSEKISDGVADIISNSPEEEPPENLETAPIEKTEQKPDSPKKASAPKEIVAKAPKKKSTGVIASIFTKRKLNESILSDLEDLLITADLGIDTAAQITDKLRKDKFDKDISDKEIKEFLAEEIAEILKPVANELKLENKPHIVLVVGVNGNGKTTSIGKLAHNYKEQGKSVMIVAADTFRAAAVEQLQEWGKRAKVPVFAGNSNQDPASVAYQAIDKAIKEDVDIVLIDTAGRLQNKHNLMQELEKINNVCKKLIPEAPHNTILVLDSTTGQNALSQVEEFSKSADITGLIVTKLDGTAKGGVVVALAKKFDISIHAVGVGEGIEDLKPFNAQDYANNLVGL